MLNRRLWILFVAFFLGFAALGARLAKLQLSDAATWQGRLQKFLHHQYIIETYRGTIVDRNGRPLAQDVPSDELAIDYRAMNLDDIWITRQAIARMQASGEWAALEKNPSAQLQRRDEVKGEIADQIDAIPGAIAAQLAPFENKKPEDLREDIYERYSKIREKVHALRQDLWSRKYTRPSKDDPHNPANSAVASNGDSESEPDDASLDSLFRQLQIEDEVASHSLKADIPAPVALYFKQHAADFPGLSVRDNAAYNRRAYPFGPATAHLIGTLRSVRDDTYKGHKFDLPDLLDTSDPGDLGGYLPGDSMGDSGVELLAEDQLRGQRGTALVDLDKTDGKPAEDRKIDLVAGKNVPLTLDASLQQDLFNALLNPGKGLLKGEDGKTHFAAMVVLSMDGQVYASVSFPSFDPNAFDEQRGELMKDAWRTPLLNRALSGTYPPGSTVKPLLATAALTEKVITPEETIVCEGHFFRSRPDIFKCVEVHGPISMVNAIAESCNVYFYTVGQRLGVERLSRWYGTWGFGQDTGLELPENFGKIPQPLQRDADEASNVSLLLGIGQGPISVTPLQMANAYATLLRGGVVIPPRILMGTPSQKLQPFAVSPQILATVRQGMEKCVTEGTAKEHFRGFHLRVAGKTGTAEKERPVFDDTGKPVDDIEHPLTNPDGSPKKNEDGTPAYKQLIERHDDAWFVGYAPADNPKFVVAAVMEWGGYGGAHAVPMVREAFTQLETHGYLPKLDTP